MVILLVGDDIQARFSTWKLLKANKFTVLAAGNGEAALETSRHHQGPVDLLLADLEMPRMNGVELGKKLAVERPGIKVLVMYGDPRGREQASMNGLPSLRKSVSPAALLDSIQALVDHAGRTSSSPAAGRDLPLSLSAQP
jgi:CheY-like chemotaxis protein